MFLLVKCIPFILFSVSSLYKFSHVLELKCGLFFRFILTYFCGTPVDFKLLCHYNLKVKTIIIYLYSLHIGCVLVRKSLQEFVIFYLDIISDGFENCGLASSPNLCKPRLFTVSMMLVMDFGCL